MKMRLRVIATMAALAVLMVVNQSALAQNKLEGVWKYTEFVSPDGKTTPAQPGGLLIFTKTYWSMVLVSGDKPQPALPQNATDAQKVATWTPFSASTGTYEVKGNTYNAKTILSKSPGTPPDFFITIEFRIEGNTLITTPKVTSTGQPVNMGYSKLIRVE